MQSFLNNRLIPLTTFCRKFRFRNHSELIQKLDRSVWTAAGHSTRGRLSV